MADGAPDLVTTFERKRGQYGLDAQIIQKKTRSKDFYCFIQDTISLQFRSFTTNCFETKKPTHCCVRGCPKKGYRNMNGTKRTFFKFCIDNLQMKKRWLHAIRKDEGKHINVTDPPSIQRYSLFRFSVGDIIKTLAGKNDLKAGVPSVFPWVRDQPRKRKEPTVRNMEIPQNSKKISPYMYKPLQI